MNRTEITLNGVSTPLTFGSWVMGQLIKSGYQLSELQKAIADNPFEFFPLLVYLGAVNATASKDKDAFSVNQFYDWLDEVGGVGSDEVSRVIKCFTNSLGTDVPDTKKKGSEEHGESREINWEIDHVAFACGELGLRLHEFYDMPWCEYIIKSYAYYRIDDNDWKKSKYIAWHILTSSMAIDSKKLVSLQKFVTGESKKISKATNEAKKSLWSSSYSIKKIQKNEFCSIHTGRYKQLYLQP